jgi:hypothetical protein
VPATPAVPWGIDVEADTLDQKQILDLLAETIRELDEPHRHLVELRLNRIRTAFAAGDLGREEPPSGGEPAPRRRLGRRRPRTTAPRRPP